MHVTAPPLIAAAAVGMHVQVSTSDADVLVDRTGRYLVKYETQLSTVVAKEQYPQSETQFRFPWCRECCS